MTAVTVFTPNVTSEALRSFYSFWYKAAEVLDVLKVLKKQPVQRHCKKLNRLIVIGSFTNSSPLNGGGVQYLASPVGVPFFLVH